MSDFKDWDPDKALDALTAEKALEGLEPDVHKMAERLLRENLPMAVMSICHLSTYEPNPMIRFNAAKYILERTMGSTDRMSTPTGEPAWANVYKTVLTEAESYVKGHGRDND